MSDQGTCTFVVCRISSDIGHTASDDRLICSSVHLFDYIIIDVELSDVV